MLHSVAATVVLATALSAPDASEADVVWTIGLCDDRPAEFAFGRDEAYARYPAGFPSDVAFRVGSSDPAREFCYIHPGPMDAWAGSRAHDVRVTFSIDGSPSGSYMLTLDLCRSHYAFPPVLDVEVNGAHQGSVRTDRDGHHQKKYVLLRSSELREGENELRIVNSTGSWAVYDALELERFPPGVPVERLSAIRLRDTVLFREVDGVLHQVVHAEVDGFWDESGVLRLRSPEGVRSYPAKEVALGSGLYELTIPIPSAPIPYSLELETARIQLAAEELRVVSPHRRWTIYAALKTHYDLGYTHPVDVMLREAAGGMLETILGHCEETRDFPEETRFRWVYPTWVLEKIAELLPESRRAAFDEAVQRGDIGWHAAPFTLHSYFCGLEDFVRALYPSTRLERRYARKVRWAKQTDVPGHTRLFPQVLRKSGVRLLQIGANFGVRGEQAPLLFYWESPDGSRILTQLTPGYGWRYDDALLTRLEADPDYPWDAFLALYVTGDNVGPADLVEVSRLARRLRDRYAYPRLRIGPVDEFVDAVEARFRDRIPIVRTELTDWWIHGVASMAREVALARRARELLPAAEKLGALAGVAGSPAPWPTDLVDEAYEQSLLFSEHTWGMSGFKPEPKPRDSQDLQTNESDGYRQMRESWKVKGDEARSASELSERLCDQGARELAEALGIPRGTVVVFNTLNWKRSGLARATATELGGAPSAVRRIPDGSAVPFQRDGDEIVFLATDVPPMGYAAYRVETGPQEAPTQQTVTSTTTLENELYRIRLDADAGAIRSIVDKRIGRELLDPDAEYGLGQYVYEGMARADGAGWHGSPYRGPGTGRRTPTIGDVRVERGPVLSRFVAEGSLPIEGFPLQIGSVERVVQTITLPHHLDWIETEVRLYGKSPTALVEQGNVAFPFGIESGAFRLELLGSVVDPTSDLQQAGNHDAFAVQHWVDVSGPDAGVTWAPLDTTIVTLGGFRLFQWSPDYVPTSTHIYANALNNGWSTNFQEWQGGDFRFRFRLRGHRGSWVEGGAARFGWETAQPFVVCSTRRDGAPGRRPEPRASALRADATHTVLVNLKRAEDGDGYILRLFNPSPTDDTVTVESERWSLSGAERVLANELPLSEAAPGSGLNVPDATIPMEDGRFSLSVGPFALETVRVHFARQSP